MISRFLELMQEEVEYVWKEVNIRNTKKIIHITTKWKREENSNKTPETKDGMINEILIDDDKLKERYGEYTPNINVYGNVVLNSEEKKIIKLPP